jgi:hypothetical protein
MSTDSGDASFLIEHPLFVRLLDELEKDATNAAIYASYDDHEARQAHCAEARAIRALRTKLKALAEQGSAKPVRRGAVA